MRRLSSPQLQKRFRLPNPEIEQMGDGLVRFCTDTRNLGLRLPPAPGQAVELQDDAPMMGDVVPIRR